MKKIFFLILLISISGCSQFEDKKTYYKCEGSYRTLSITKPYSVPEKIEFSLVINKTKKTYLFQDWNKIKSFNNINDGKVEITDIQVSSSDLKKLNGFELNLVDGHLEVLIRENPIEEQFVGSCNVVQPKI
jgi:uncharacterized lipoprotein YehR (DUF1307 family)